MGTVAAQLVAMGGGSSESVCAWAQHHHDARRQL